MSVIVWTIAESKQLAAELVAGARAVAGADAQVVAFVGADEGAAQELVAAGADAARAMPLPADAPWEAYVPVLAKLAQDAAPRLILVGATKRGKDMAAQLAGLLDAPCVSDAKDLRLDNGTLEAGRMVYGGMAVKTLSSTSPTVVATISAQCFEALAPDASRSGDVQTLAPEAGAVKVVAREPRQKGGVNLAEATRVVGVGRGFTEESDLQLARDLAEAMEAEVACTRPIAEFFKWLPEELYLGISGQVIKPQVYLAAGVSGQAQHVYGVRDSKVIVGVNKDENAPIFQTSDYYIVGDVKEVLPALTKAFKEHGNA
ncbi:electron transfer flavoprotein subunit alpha/FixB family protein [Desulfocurvus sp. DL9XJH121]